MPYLYCTLQHTAAHCNTFQHTAAHCNTLQHTAAHCNTLPRTATHCNTVSSFIRTRLEAIFVLQNVWNIRILCSSRYTWRYVTSMTHMSHDSYVTSLEHACSCDMSYHSSLRDMMHLYVTWLTYIHEHWNANALVRTCNIYVHMLLMSMRHLQHMYMNTETFQGSCAPVTYMYTCCTCRCVL